MRAHDVRRLAVCRDCGELGADDADVAGRLGLPLVLKVGRDHRHPEHMTVPELLALTIPQQESIRLSDIGSEKMRVLIQRYTDGLPTDARIGG